MNKLEKAYEEIESWHIYSEQEGFVAEEEISYLDYIKKHINNLQFKIDKAIKKLEYYNSGEALYYVPIQDIIDILKEDK